MPSEMITFGLGAMANSKTADMANLLKSSMPRNNITDKGVKLGSFADPAAFTNTNSVKDANTITTIRYHSGLSEAMPGTRITANGDGVQSNLVWSFTSADWSAYTDFTLRFYVEDVSALELMYIYFINTTTSNYYSITVKPKWSASSANYHIAQGLNTLKILRSDLPAHNSPVWTDIIQIQITIKSATGKRAAVTFFDDIIAQQVSKPKVIVAFDDAYLSQYTIAFPYMTAKGIKGVIYAVKDFAQGTNANYMREAQLDEMYNAGWDICNQTMSHTILSTLTLDQAREEVVGCRDWLLSRGYSANRCNHIATPGNLGDDDVTEEQLAMCKEVGMLTGRDSRLGIQTWPFENILRIRCRGTSDSSYFTDPWLKRTKLLGGTFLVYFHNVGSDATAESEFKKCIDLILDSGMQVVTISEWYNGLNL